jgi:ABC-2 type transport system ATP-binding protein
LPITHHPSPITDRKVAAIQVEGISKHYGGLKALDEVSLGIAQGEFFGLLGPNGAGKTTLINILAGLVLPTSGRARVMGHDVVDGYRDARRALGVVPQELVFDPFFTVREALTFQSGYFGLRDNRAWIEEVMHHLDLTVRAETNMRALSGGMKRRVLVAQALVHKPPVIVLDEPTAGVDVELRQALWQFIRRLNRDGHTIVLTTHYLEEAETLCGRIAMLKHGRVVALDEKENLLRLHSGCYLELRIQPDRLPAELEARVVQRREDGYRLALPDYVEVERVLARLRGAGIEILELEVMQPDLEEIFVQIMQKS